MPAGLHIRLLGPLSVERDGVRPELPQSRKTRGLLAYLVAEARPHSRARLGELLWAEVDDPRGGLRWSLSKLRPLLDDETVTRWWPSGTAWRSKPTGLKSTWRTLKET